MRVDLHHAEINKIPKSPETMEYLLTLAERLKIMVLLNAPVGERQRGPRFINSIYVKVLTGDKPGVRVGSTSFKAWWIEFGAVRPNSVFYPRAPFRRALALLNLENEVRPG